MGRRMAWHSDISSDKINYLYDPNGFKSYWHDLNKKPCQSIRRRYTVMVWATFSFTSKTPIIARKFSFLAGYCRIHVSRYLKEQFNKKENIGLLMQPARSSDLNPIENFWGILSRRIYKNSKPYGKVGALEHAIKKGQNETFIRINIQLLILSVLQTFICSMNTRIFKFISNRDYLILIMNFYNCVFFNKFIKIFKLKFLYSGNLKLKITK